MRIAVQGIAGCFSEAAAAQLAPGSETVYCRTFEDIFKSLAAGTAARGLVPVENTIAGEIAATRKLLAGHPVRVLAETRLRIEQCLIATPGATLAGIGRVFSHPVALQQCGQFLAHHPHWRVEAYFDTAAGVQHIMQEARPDQAAIAGPQAAAVYRAQILARGIGDVVDNFTRFVLVEAKPA
ncbi:MAG: prephenate dehydratase domain-containing protein [Terriglobales bacterium]